MNDAVPESANVPPAAASEKDCTPLHAPVVNAAHTLLHQRQELMEAREMLTKGPDAMAAGEKIAGSVKTGFFTGLIATATALAGTLYALRNSTPLKRFGLSIPLSLAAGVGVGGASAMLRGQGMTDHFKEMLKQQNAFDDQVNIIDAQLQVLSHPEKGSIMVDSVDARVRMGWLVEPGAPGTIPTVRRIADIAAHQEPVHPNAIAAPTTQSTVTMANGEVMPGPNDPALMQAAKTGGTYQQTVVNHPDGTQTVSQTGTLDIATPSATSKINEILKAGSNSARMGLEFAGSGGTSLHLR